MPIGSLTRLVGEPWRRILKILDFLVLLGMVGGLTMWIILFPPSERWGVSFSQKRIMLMFTYTVMVALPLWLWSIYRYATKQRWLAEDLGVTYEPGKRYPFLTHRRILHISVGVLLYGLSGIFSSSPIDLPQFVATYMMIIYGPVEGGLSAGLGFLLIRGPFLDKILNPYYLITYGLGGGLVYLIAGQFYREYLRHLSIRWRGTLGLILYLLFSSSFHAGLPIPGLFWGVAEDYIGFGPIAVSLARRTWRVTYLIPFIWIPTSVAAYAASMITEMYGEV